MKPKVEYDRNVYSLKSKDTYIPNLNKMTRIEAFMWLNKFTHAKGYKKESIRLPTITIL